MFTDYIFSISRYAIPFLSVVILLRNLRSLLRGRTEPEIWAYLRVGQENVPVYHWESLIGRARSADIRLFGEGISPIHAVLKRTDKGRWSIYDVFSRSGVWVNSVPVPEAGISLRHGDLINLGGSCVRFLNLSTQQRQRNENKRTGAGKLVNPAFTLGELTLLQLFLLLQHAYSARQADFGTIALSFATLIVLEWCVYEAMRLMNRMGFEMEIFAFYLTTIGLTVAASSVPEDISIVGFDNSIPSTVVTPKLTTINQFMRKKAERAVAMLLRAMEDPTYRDDLEVMDVDLVKRRSVARL